MKNLLITSAVLAMLATPTLALELGNKLSFNNELEAAYSVETDVFIALNTAELAYQVNDDLRVYVDTTIDLQDIYFTGANLGVSYNPASFDNITITTEMSLDSNLDYNDVVLSAKLKF